MSRNKMNEIVTVYLIKHGSMILAVQKFRQSALLVMFVSIFTVGLKGMWLVSEGNWKQCYWKIILDQSYQSMKGCSDQKGQRVERKNS